MVFQNVFLSLTFFLIPKYSDLDFLKKETQLRCFEYLVLFSSLLSHKNLIRSRVLLIISLERALFMKGI